MGKKHRRGVPRTASAARKRGLKPLGFHFMSMPASESMEFNLIHLDTLGARQGAIGIIGTLPPKKVPGTEPGTHLVCYYEESTGDYTNCVIVHDLG